MSSYTERRSRYLDHVCKYGECPVCGKVVKGPIPMRPEVMVERIAAMPEHRRCLQDMMNPAGRRTPE